MSQPLQPQRTEDEWRNFVAEQLRRQTHAAEQLRGMMIFFTVLAALVIVVQLLVLAGS